MPRFACARVASKWARAALPLAAASLTAIPACIQCQSTPDERNDGAPHLTPFRVAASFDAPSRTTTPLGRSATSPAGAGPTPGACAAVSRWSGTHGGRPAVAHVLPAAPAPAPATAPGPGGANAGAGAGAGGAAFSDLFAAAVDCQRKSCDEGKTHKFKNMFTQMQERAEALPGAGGSRHGSGHGSGGGGSGSGVAAGATTAAAGAAAAAAAGKGKASEQFTCPSKDDIGMCTWTLVRRPWVACAHERGRVPPRHALPSACTCTCACAATLDCFPVSRIAHRGDQAQGGVVD